MTHVHIKGPGKAEAQAKLAPIHMHRPMKTFVVHLYIPHNRMMCVCEHRAWCWDTPSRHCILLLELNGCSESGHGVRNVRFEPTYIV